jgi:2-polyprenyl-3-methyl-5-hydroxy-6-metoxy-1,4-benzoquinol methylase
MSETTTLDETKSAAFADRLLDTLNRGALALMFSIGHRTRLFDAMGDGAWTSSEALARRAGLNERYVREWLGALVTGGAVDYNPNTRSYRLPPEHAAFLTRAAGANNFAAFMQYVSVLGAVEDRIVACFQHGGGVPYDAFQRFHEVMAEDSGQTVLPALNDHILPLVPGLVERLRAGIDVLDLGCGSGRALNQMARDYPKSRFQGIDFSKEAIGRARGEASQMGLANITFEVMDAAGFEEVDRYDLITTFDAIHDQAEPARVLRNIQRALRPTGAYLIQDISGTSHLEKDIEHPAGPFLYAASTMHCMTVSLAVGGAGLGTMWGEEVATRMLTEAGFTDLKVHRLPHDFQNIYVVARKRGSVPGATDAGSVVQRTELAR